MKKLLEEKYVPLVEPKWKEIEAPTIKLPTLPIGKLFERSTNNESISITIMQQTNDGSQDKAKQELF